MILVLRPGPLTTVQDLGRPGYGHLGVGRSGAADRRSLRLANRLVGNVEGAACLEMTLGGLSVQLESEGTIALAGAACQVTVGGRGGSMSTPLVVHAGHPVAVGAPSRGVRTYLAVRGGLDVPRVLGSRSTDTLAGLGPPGLAEGDLLPVGHEVVGLPPVDVAPVPTPPDDVHLRVHVGPRDDWFVDDAVAALTSGWYEVTPRSDRVGVRLAGVPLRRSRTEELPSEGMVEGALQVTPDGQPTLLLADHPVTGGYPVIAVVEPADIALAAQARPGQRVAFRVVW